MTWTTDKPKRTGWYWYCATPDTEPYPVKIFDANPDAPVGLLG